MSQYIPLIELPQTAMLALLLSVVGVSAWSILRQYRLTKQRRAYRKKGARG